MDDRLVVLLGGSDADHLMHDAADDDAISRSGWYRYVGSRDRQPLVGGLDQVVHFTQVHVFHHAAHGGVSRSLGDGAGGWVVCPSGDAADGCSAAKFCHQL